MQLLGFLMGGECPSMGCESLLEAEKATEMIILYSVHGPLEFPLQGRLMTGKTNFRFF